MVGTQGVRPSGCLGTEELQVKNQVIPRGQMRSPPKARHERQVLLHSPVCAPVIILQRNYLESNACLRICFYGHKPRQKLRLQVWLVLGASAIASGSRSSPALSARLFLLPPSLTRRRHRRCLQQDRYINLFQPGVETGHPLEQKLLREDRQP